MKRYTKILALILAVVLLASEAIVPVSANTDSTAENTVQMSPLLNNYDIVSVQEDFAYHDDLILELTLPYRTEHSGNVVVGDGMNIFSKFPIYLETRYEWED